MPEMVRVSATAVLGSEALPPELAPRVITPRQFMDRLSQAKQTAVAAAALSSPAVLLWMTRLSGALEVDLDHPETIAGVDALRASSLITAADAAALLA